MPTELVKECRDAARVMRELGTFESGQGILLDAATEIETLRKIVIRYGDRIRMATIHDMFLQQCVDRAFEFTTDDTKE